MEHGADVSETGGDTDGFTTDALTETTWYRVFVSASESGCEDVYSDEVAVIVSPDISISAQPVGDAICEGGIASLSVTASGSPNITYQWQDSIASGTWADVSEIGGDTDGFTTDALTETTWYRVFVSASESGCEDVYSDEVAVIVSPDISDQCSTSRRCDLRRWYCKFKCDSEWQSEYYLPVAG